MPSKAPSFQVLAPNLGLFYDRPPEAVPPGGLVDCKNVRIKQGRLQAVNMGRSLFLSTALNGALGGIYDFFLSNGSAPLLIFSTLTDLYNYNGGTPVFITPVYVTGTIAVTAGGAVTGTGTAWNTKPANDIRNNVQAGDFIYIGANNQNSPTATWWKVQSVASDTSLQLANYTGGVVAAGSAYTARQTFTGTLDNKWNFETFPNAAPSLGDLMFATNGLDSPVTWNGSTTFAVRQVSTLGFTCISLIRYKDQMIYLGLTLSSGSFQPYSMANSDTGSPLVVNGTGVSGTNIITDGDQPIVGALRLFDNLVIYCGGVNPGDRAIVLATFVGTPLNYVFRNVVSNRGPLCGGLIADFGYFHKFISAEGMWLFNGFALELVGTQVWRQVVQGYDVQRIKRAWTHFDEVNGDLIWAIPLTSDTGGQGPEQAYVEHYLEDNVPGGQPPFTRRDMVTTCAGYYKAASSLTFNLLTQGFNTYNIPWNANILQAGAPFVLVGDANGFIYQLNNTDTMAVGNNNNAFPTYATFPPRVLGNLRNKMLIRRVYPFMEQINGTLLVSTTPYDRVGGVPGATVVNNYDMSQAGQRFVNPFVISRLGQVQVGTQGPNQPWICRGYDLDVVPGGER